MRSKIRLFVLYSFLAEPAFCSPDCSAQTLCTFSTPSSPRLSLWSDTSLHMSLTQNILWLDLFWFCLIPILGKEDVATPCSIALNSFCLFSFECCLIQEFANSLWWEKPTIQMHSRWDLWPKGKVQTFSYYPYGMPGPCSPALAVLICSRMSWYSSKVSNK